MLLVTIPGTSFKLDTGAQASLARMVANGCPLQITTAYRDRAYQQRLRDLYLAGKGSYALPAGRRPHGSTSGPHPTAGLGRPDGTHPT